MNDRPKILINRQGAGGDVLMTTPIFRKIHQDHSGACDIDFCTFTQNEIWVRHNPHIKRVITSHVIGTGAAPAADMIAKYDQYIDLDNVYERNPGVHAIDAYAEVAIGHSDFDRSLELHTTDQDKEFARELKQILNNDYIVLHIRKHFWENRNLPTTFWQALVEKLLDQTSLTIVQIGGTHEPCISGHDRLIDLRGGTTILNLKEVIANSRLFIGSDSGPTHVAASTATNMMVFYTTVREEYRRPLRTVGRFVPMIPDIECYGCHRQNTPESLTMCFRENQDMECLNRFDLDKAAATAVELSQ